MWTLDFWGFFFAFERSHLHTRGHARLWDDRCVRRTLLVNFTPNRSGHPQTCTEARACAAPSLPQPQGLVGEPAEGLRGPRSYSSGRGG